MSYELTRSGAQVESALDRADAALSPEWWAEQPVASLSEADTQALRQAQREDDLGEGTAITLPGYSGSFTALITGDASIAITPPAENTIQQLLSIRAGVVARCGALIDVQNATLPIAITASTAPRTIMVYLGGTDATATLTPTLADDSATASPLEFEFVGQGERRVAISFAAGEASTLDLVYELTSASGSAYISAVTLVGPSDTTGDPLLSCAVTPWTPGRVWLSREGLQDWALFGRTAGDSTDSKPDATDIQALSVTGDTRTQATSLSEYVFEDAAPANTYQATLVGAAIWPPEEGLIDLIPGGGEVMVGLLVRPSGASITRASISVLPSAASSTPLPTTLLVTGDDYRTSLGGTEQFTAAVLDQYGAAMAGRSVLWSLPDGGGSISDTGLFTGLVDGGPYRVVATDALQTSIRGEATVTVGAESSAGVLIPAVTTIGDVQVDLTAEGTLDWVHLGDTLAADVTSKADATETITPYLVGATSNDRWDPSSTAFPGFTWTDGDPVEARTDRDAHADFALANAAPGKGFGFTFPADTSERVAVIYARGADNTVRLTAALSDSSDTPVSEALTIVGVGWRRAAFTYRAASAGQTLDVRWVQESAAGNVGAGAATLAAGTGTVELTSITVTPDTATLIEGATQQFAIDALDQYDRRIAGQAVGVAVSGGGTLSAASVNAGESVVFSAVTAGGPYTLTASVGAVDDTAAITVTAPETAELPTIAWSQANIDQAVALPLCRLGDTSQSAYGQFNLGIPYLSLLTAFDDTIAATNGTLVADRAAQQISYTLSAAAHAANTTTIDHHGPCGQLDDHYWFHLPFSLALAKNTPSLWSRLTPDTQARADWYMKLVAWVVNFGLNHKYCDLQYAARGVREQHIGVIPWRTIGTNPNQRITFPYAILSLVYWGDLAALNAVIASYSVTEVNAAFTAYGWTKWVKPWTSSVTFRASMDTGVNYPGVGDMLGFYARFTSLGIREPLTHFYGLRITDPTSAIAYWAREFRSTPVAVTIPNLIEAEIKEYNYGKNVHRGPLGSSYTCNGYGRLNDDAPNQPYYGLPYMAHEYAIGNRSSHTYVVTGQRFHLSALLAAMVTGHYPQPLNAAVKNHLALGMEVVSYCDSVGWRDNEYCQVDSNGVPIDAALRSNKLNDAFNGPWHLELVSKLFIPTLVWP